MKNGAPPPKMTPDDQLAFAAFEARYQLLSHLKTHPHAMRVDAWSGAPAAYQAGYRLIARAVLKRYQELVKGGLAAARAEEAAPTALPEVGSEWEHERYGRCRVVAVREPSDGAAAFVRLGGAPTEDGTRVIQDVPAPIGERGWKSCSAEGGGGTAEHPHRSVPEGGAP